MPDGGKTVSRRAAYNLLDRLRKNPQRLQNVDPSMREKLLTTDSHIPSDMISGLMNHGGDLEALSASFRASRESALWDKSSSKLKPLTEMEVIQRYGEKEAGNVMKHKKASGMTRDDPNNPGKSLYLMMDEERPGKQICCC